MTSLFVSSTIFNKVRIYSPSVYQDERGLFFETYSSEKYQISDERGQEIIFKEDDISISYHKVLRGLHGDKITWKLIQCLYGEVYFVLVDMNPQSASYLKFESFILNDVNRKQILVPPYFANGYLCNSESCIFSYKQSNTYTGSSNQFTVNWKDPKIGIPWPITNPVLSSRDAHAPNLD